MKCYLCNAECALIYGCDPGGIERTGFQEWSCQNHRVEIRQVYDLYWKNAKATPQVTFKKILIHFSYDKEIVIEVTEKLTADKARQKVAIYTVFS